MKTKACTILLFVLSINVVFTQEKVENAPLVRPKIQVVPIKDTQTNRLYELSIQLPKGYSGNTDKRYPVLYFTDVIWHEEILSDATEQALTETILIGISWQKDTNKDLLEKHGEHVSRYRDYSIVKSTNPEHQTKYQFGQANNHLAFIRNDVIRFVESHYRTIPENRSYFGYSLGGLFGAYILLSQPDTFKNYILGSPSMDGNIPELKRLASNIPDQSINANIFVSYGKSEEELGSYTDQFIKLLKTRNDTHLFITHKVFEGDHLTSLPLTGVQSVTWLSDLIK